MGQQSGGEVDRVAQHVPDLEADLAAWHHKQLDRRIARARELGAVRAGVALVFDQPAVGFRIAHLMAAVARLDAVGIGRCLSRVGNVFDDGGGIAPLSDKFR